MPDSTALTSATVYRLSLPLDRTLVNGRYRIDSLEFVVLELSAEDYVGTGYAFVFHPRQAQALEALVTDLTEIVVGHQIGSVRERWQQLHQRMLYIGQTGMALMALSVVDTALWDVASQARGLPLYALLGAPRREVPVYLSGGWLSYSVQELVADAIGGRDQGVPRYKMKVGHNDWHTDVARVTALREAVGDTVELMVDANQAWDLATALEAGRAFEDLGVTWFEEPLPAFDVEGYRVLTESLKLSVATGESLFTRAEFEQFAERSAASVLMPDLMHCGGPTGFLDACAQAEAHGVAVSSHLFVEASSHLIASRAPGSLVEYMPGWSAPLFEPGREFEDGNLRLSDQPGIGVRLTHEAVERYSSSGHGTAVVAAQERGGSVLSVKSARE